MTAPVVVLKKKHGPNIRVSMKRDRKPRSYSHAYVAVEQAKRDILTLHKGGCSDVVIASLSIQINEIRRYLDGE